MVIHRLHFGKKHQNIWTSGSVELLNKCCISVIGTRLPTVVGQLRTKKVRQIIVEKDFVVVSGLALGVDTIAHTSALECGGQTIAVIPNSIEECYPKANLGLKQQIAREGLVITQFDVGSKVYKSNFIRRNRLMADISDMTIVTEALENSGTRHQVERCLKTKKPVGFLSSLVEKRYPWVVSAIDSGVGFEIDSPESLAVKLDDI